jgi:AraC-like DNA-binding protein
VSLQIVQPSAARSSAQAAAAILVTMTSFEAQVSHLTQSADPLGEALHFLRMTGAFYCRTELGAPCGLEMPAMPDCLAFHAALTGECWLDVDGLEPVLLAPGDLALVPHGSGHRLATHTGVATPNIFELPHDYLSDRYAVLRHGDDSGAAITLVCGAVQFDHPAAANLIAMLPPVIHISGSDATRPGGLDQMLELMGHEARELRTGGETVITRLCDIVVIQAIRAWLERDDTMLHGWLGAIGDEQIGSVISAIHRHPERDWTLNTLAATAMMSRSGFTARFTYLVGEPPMQYLTNWRMNLACDQLNDGTRSIADVASGLGYQSEASFSRAFKRTRGYPPSEARRATKPAR